MTGMEGNFISNGRSCHLRLDETGIMWRDTASEKFKFIPITEVVSSWLCPKGHKSCFQTPVTSTGAGTLLPSVHVVEVDDRKINGVALPQQLQPSKFTSYRTFPPSGYEWLNLSQEQVSIDIEPTSCKHVKNWNLSLNEGSFCLEYCERVRPPRLHRCLDSNEVDGLVGAWRTRVVVFSHASRQVVLEWYYVVWDKIRALKDRPRHLVVIVNPKSGNCDGLTEYRHQVAPLFARAGIATTVQETTPNSTGEAFARAAASTPGVDGVVVVGGDGVLVQVVMGLVREAAARTGVNTDDPHADLPRPELRVGIIPVGTTNCTTKCLHGVSDPITSALHVVMGDRVNIDIAAVYSSTGLMTYVTNVMGGGYVGGTLKRVDSYRRFSWMTKNIRLAVAGLRELVQFRSYQVSLRVLVPEQPQTTPFDEEICTSACSICSNKSSGNTGTDVFVSGVGSGGGSSTATLETNCTKNGKEANVVEGTAWKTLSGRYYSVLVLLLSARGVNSRYGLSPAAHTGDGCCDVLLAPATGPVRGLATMWRGVTQRNHLRHPGITVLRCKALTVESPKVFPWSADGELQEVTSVNIRVHRQKLPVFARGIERRPTRQALTQYVASQKIQ